MEVETVEKFLKNQLIAAFDEDYVQALRDANDIISLDIPQMIEYLVKAYGQIRPEEFRSMKTEVEDYIFDPLLPIDVLFNKLEFFLDVADIVSKTVPDAKKVDIIYIILNRCGVFQDSLKKWNKKPAIDQTYDEMKKFFCQEQLDLDKVNALTKQDSSLNQVDFLNEQRQVMEQMESRLKLNLVEAINSFAEAYEDSKPPASDPDDSISDLASANSATITRTNKSEDAMLKLLQGLCKKVEDLSSNQKTCPPADQDKENVNPRTGRAWRRYCWNHGCCDHWGSKRPKRKPGHKVNATFKNRLGGSTAGVLGA